MKTPLLVFAFLVFSTIFIFGTEEIPSYKTVSAMVEGAVAAIEAKDADKFFDNYVSPKDISKIKEQGQFDEAKKSFMGSEKAGALVLALKNLKDIVPVYNKEKDCLTFKDEKLGAIVLSREVGKWYIKN